MGMRTANFKRLEALSQQQLQSPQTPDAPTAGARPRPVNPFLCCLCLCGVLASSPSYSERIQLQIQTLLHIYITTSGDGRGRVRAAHGTGRLLHHHAGRVCLSVVAVVGYRSVCAPLCMGVGLVAVRHPTNTIHHPPTQFTNQPIHQPTNQPTNPITRPITQPTNQPLL
jgi:hypothetical protein